MQGICVRRHEVEVGRLSFPLYLIHWSRVSEFNPELTICLVWLARLFCRSPITCCLAMELQTHHQAYLYVLCSFWRPHLYSCRAGALTTKSSVQSLNVIFFSKPNKTLFYMSRNANGQLQVEMQFGSIHVDECVNTRNYGRGHSGRTPCCMSIDAFFIWVPFRQPCWREFMV